VAKKQIKQEIIIEKPKDKIIKLRIIGDTELKMHRLGKKAKEELDHTKEGKRAKKSKPRNYQEEFMDSMHYIDKVGKAIFEPPKKLLKTTRFGFPASGFKKAMISAVRQYQNVKMTEVKGIFFIIGEYVEIKGTPLLDGFWRRIGGKGPGTGTPDWGIRAKFPKWSAELTISYTENFISPDSIANLLDAAGRCVGIGEDRPEKAGNSFGRWHVASAQERS